MLIKCNKIISHVTKKDLGDASPWLKKGKEYIVLALNISGKGGIEVCIQTEHYNEPYFILLNGFEILSQQIPSSWITIIKDIYDEKIITMLPKSWAYDDFFIDLEDEKPEALILFNQEAELIYREQLISTL
jgi:hypothetical protein